MELVDNRVRALDFASNRALPPLPLAARTHSDGEMRRRLLIALVHLALIVAAALVAYRLFPQFAGEEGLLAVSIFAVAFFFVTGGVHRLVRLRPWRPYRDPQEEYVVAADRFVLRRAGMAVIDQPWSELSLLDCEVRVRKSAAPLLVSLTLAPRGPHGQNREPLIEARATPLDTKLLDAIARKLVEAGGVQLK